MKTRSLMAAVALATVLGACGGDDHGEPAGGGGSGGDTFPPASASGSNDGFVQFILSLVNTSNDSDSPAELTGESLPADDESVPVDI